MSTRLNGLTSNKTVYLIVTVHDKCKILHNSLHRSSNYQSSLPMSPHLLSVQSMSAGTVIQFQESCVKELDCLIRTVIIQLSVYLCAAEAEVTQGLSFYGFFNLVCRDLVGSCGWWFSVLQGYRQLEHIFPLLVFSFEWLFRGVLTLEVPT